MNPNQTASDAKALVTVFEDLETARIVVERLHESGFALDKIELVTNDVDGEAPEVKTPKIHDTTQSTMVDGAAKWGGVGVGSGILAGLLTGFPGLALGMTITAGVTGAIMGAVAGVDHAVEDDSVDLPTIAEYEQLVKNGNKLVVVLGNHEEVIRAEEVVKEMLHVRRHIHTVHGHEYHEHPVRKAANKTP